MPRQLGIRHHQEREREDTQKLDIICSIIYIKQNIFHPCTCKANMQSHQLFLGLLEKKGNIKDISCSSSGGNRRHRIFSSLVAYSVRLAREDAQNHPREYISQAEYIYIKYISG